PEAHFHGPLTITPKRWRIAHRADRLTEKQFRTLGLRLPQPLKQLGGKELFSELTLPESLKRGEPTDLDAAIITEGRQSWVSVSSPYAKERQNRPVPDGIQPLVDVEFPAKKRGAPPTKKRYPLEQFCRDGGFRGPVRVPEGAGVGKARATFSFDAWKGVKVAPTTVEIPVVEP